MNDDRLTLYYYKDGLTADERQEITEALAADAQLAARYRQLTGDLAGLGPAAEPGPVPDGLHARLHATIDRASLAEVQRQGAQTPASGNARNHWWSFLLGSAVTAALVSAVFIGLRSPGEQPQEFIPVIADSTADYSRDAFQRSVQVYFRDSQNNIDGLASAEDAERTTMIMNLVAQNRMFEKLAVQNESPQLARVLRAFEPILLRLAAADITAEDSELLRAQLAFELNVMLTKLTREASEQQQSTEQETST
jgi:anti-sigma-K factor RskA